MPVVRIESLRDVPGGTSSTRVTVTAQVYRKDKPAVRVATDDVVIPTRMEKAITGEGSITLSQIPADCNWRISFRTRDIYIRRHVVFPAGSGPFDFDELIDVDPSSSLPDAGTELAEALIDHIDASKAIIQNIVDQLSGIALSSGGAVHLGDGPPPLFIPGAQVKDIYSDQLTGNIYLLEEG